MSTRRFFDKVSVRPAGAGFGIWLDAAPLKSPAGQALHFATAALADAVAAEWRMQEKKLNPKTLPLTQLCATAQDVVAPARSAVIEGLLRYLESDLLCHRAVDAALAQRQAAAYDRLLEWFAAHYGVLLQPTTSLRARDAGAAQSQLRPRLEALDDGRLAALQLAAGVSGSVVLALALADGFLDDTEALRGAELEADFQAARWGADEEALAARAGRAEDLALAARYFMLLRQVF